MTTEEILSQFTAGKLDQDEAAKLLNANSSGPGSNGVSINTTDKGCVRLHGVSGAPIKFGIVQYPAVWLALAANIDVVKYAVGLKEDRHVVKTVRESKPLLTHVTDYIESHRQELAFRD